MDTISCKWINCAVAFVSVAVQAIGSLKMRDAWRARSFGAMLLWAVTTCIAVSNCTLNEITFYAANSKIGEVASAQSLDKSAMDLTYSFRVGALLITKHELDTATVIASLLTLEFFIVFLPLCLLDDEYHRRSELAVTRPKTFRSEEPHNLEQEPGHNQPPDHLAATTRTAFTRGPTSRTLTSVEVRSLSVDEHCRAPVEKNRNDKRRPPPDRRSSLTARSPRTASSADLSGGRLSAAPPLISKTAGGADRICRGVISAAVAVIVLTANTSAAAIESKRAITFVSPVVSSTQKDFCVRPPLYSPLYELGGEPILPPGRPISSDCCRRRRWTSCAGRPRGKLSEVADPGSRRGESRCAYSSRCASTNVRSSTFAGLRTARKSEASGSRRFPRPPRACERHNRGGREAYPRNALQVHRFRLRAGYAGCSLWICFPDGEANKDVLPPGSVSSADEAM
jgi:hypothetical protein